MSSLFSAVLVPASISVGASGALMGVFGAWLVHLLCTWAEGDEAAQRNRSFQFVMCFVNVLVVIGFSFVPYIDWAAHIFGLIGGALLGLWFFAVRPQGAAAAGSAAGSNGGTLGAALVPHGGVVPPRLNFGGSRVGGGPLPVAPPVVPTARVAGAAAAAENKAPWLRRAASVFGLAAYLGVMLAGLLGLYLNTAPDPALLNYCAMVQAAYPTYALNC